jgi:thiamine-phosphate pyrophosphorylase
LKKNSKSLKWITDRIKYFNACFIQYRNKTCNFSEKKEDILTIKSLCQNIPLIANDDIELVKYCDGIHLGQDDMLEFSSDINEAASLVKKTIGINKLFGLSTHNTDEIVAANLLPIDYIGLGAYRKTNTKDTNNILGDKLSQLACLSKKPVAAIGGVKLNDNIANVTYLVVGSGLYENHSVLN